MSPAEPFEGTPLATDGLPDKVERERRRKAAEHDIGELLRIETRIADADGRGIPARWDSGRELLSKRVGTQRRPPSSGAGVALDLLVCCASAEVATPVLHMSQQRSAAKLSRAATRLQRGRVSPALIVRQQSPEPRRTPKPSVSARPITDKQRVLLGDLRRQFHLPRHSIGHLTKAEAGREITELLAQRAANG